MTLSVGVSCFPTHGKTPETLLRAADHALYNAKAEGRDRVVMSTLSDVAAGNSPLDLSPLPPAGPLGQSEGARLVPANLLPPPEANGGAPEGGGVMRS